MMLSGASETNVANDVAKFRFLYVTTATETDIANDPIVGVLNEILVTGASEVSSVGSVIATKIYNISKAIEYNTANSLYAAPFKQYYSSYKVYLDPVHPIEINEQ